MSVANSSPSLSQSFSKHAIFGDMNQTPIRPLQLVNPASSESPETSSCKIDSEFSGLVIWFRFQPSIPGCAQDEVSRPIVTANKEFVAPHVHFRSKVAFDLKQMKPIRAI